MQSCGATAPSGRNGAASEGYAGAVRTALATLLALVYVALLPATASAETTRYVLHVPAYLVEDACNGHVVVLNGDFVITQKTTPAPDGGDLHTLPDHQHESARGR